MELHHKPVLDAHSRHFRGEHRVIRDAVHLHDVEAARAAMKTHLSAVIPDVERLRRQYPHFFLRDEAGPALTSTAPRLLPPSRRSGRARPARPGTHAGETR